MITMETLLPLVELDNGLKIGPAAARVFLESGIRKLAPNQASVGESDGVFLDRVDALYMMRFRLNLTGADK